MKASADVSLSPNSLNKPFIKNKPFIISYKSSYLGFDSIMKQPCLSMAWLALVYTPNPSSRFQLVHLKSAHFLIHLNQIKVKQGNQRRKMLNSINCLYHYLKTS